MEVLRTPWEYRFRVRDVISWMLSKKIVVLVAGPAAESMGKFTSKVYMVNIMGW